MKTASRYHVTMKLTSYFLPSKFSLFQLHSLTLYYGWLLLSHYLQKLETYLLLPNLLDSLLNLIVKVILY